MKKYDISRFYLGLLHLGYKRQSTSMQDSENYQKADSSILTLMSSDAIDLDNEEKCIIHDYCYKRFLTIFYQIDDEEYLCLHDQNIYDRYQVNYFSHLYNLKDYLPKMGWQCKEEISIHEALKIFSELFGQKVMHYQNVEFPIKNFYLGNVEACHEMIIRDNIYPYKKKCVLVNIPETELLLPYYCGGGYSLIRSSDEKSVEYLFSIYKSLLFVNNNVFYSLDSHQVYSKHKRTEFDSKATLDKPLIEELEEAKIPYNGSNITISKALQLRKKLEKKKR